MILEAKTLKLIEIYFYICKRYEEDLKYCCEKFRPEDCCLDQSLLDSMPIITCSGISPPDRRSLVVLACGNRDYVGN